MGINNYILCCPSEIAEVLPVYFVVYFVQFIYTCIIWGTFLSIHVINSIFQGIMLLISFIAIFIFCRFNIKRGSGSESQDYQIAFKFVPIGFLIMTLFSFLPCFVALLEFFDDPT